MEKFFRKTVLEVLYEAVNFDFEEAVAGDKKEGKEYQKIVRKQDDISQKVSNIIPKEKKDKFIELSLDFDGYKLEEMQYWAKKYFKLGITYMVALNNPKEFEENISFSVQVHNFLDSIRTKKMNEKQKLLLSTFINELPKATEKQKGRFLRYYNLIPNNNHILNYSDIAKIEHCSNSTIRTSVGAIILQLVNLEDSQKALFLTIMNEINI